MSWFKKLFTSNNEEVAKAASSDKGIKPKQQVSHNDAENQGVIPEKQTKPKAPAFPGWDAACKGDEAWDKGRRGEAAQHYEQALAEGFNNGDQHFWHLGIYYTERKDWENLKRILSVTPGYMLTQNWAVKGKRLLEENFGKMPNGWISIEADKTANGETTDTWLEKYERLISAFPQFDFDEGDNESKIKDEDRAALREFELELEKKKQAIEQLVDSKDYRQAATLSAEFIRNGYWKVWPYEALMEIYAKAGLLEERKRLAEHALTFFRARRDEMKRSAIWLAGQVDCSDFVAKMIKEGKRIAYYEGLFDVYNLYPETEKWSKLIGG